MSNHILNYMVSFFIRSYYNRYELIITLYVHTLLKSTENFSVVCVLTQVMITMGPIVSDVIYSQLGSFATSCACNVLC